ncbi:DUF4430 domain-containing protein [Tuanshanicoccus lijuaniae]|uniref:DUF4430 domain-containing protein n=1 Tax=Aerococcaceae bacterium zg-1292 TaxID=2774330 RepID=UPI001BD84913|nr:DUF4430 domain-containing protein [Aerococcaceae bacterium zg-A91]MBS4457913.1 DUF4430 domain-containing protein [Aerococcaceae bacterium zg-BR33]
MKKIAKLISLPILTLALAACGQLNSPAPETTTAAPETTTMAPETTTEAQVSTPNDSTTTVAGEEGGETTTSADSETTESSDSDNMNSDVAENDVLFKVFVDGEEKAKYVAKDAVGKSVLEAMESIEDFDFNFDKEEGIVNQISGIENDYDNLKTWVYLLNGEYAEYGVVSQTLSKGDVVEWYFGTTDDLPVKINQ